MPAINGLDISPGFICSACRHMGSTQPNVKQHCKTHTTQSNVIAHPCYMQELLPANQRGYIEVTLPLPSSPMDQPEDVLRAVEALMDASPDVYNPQMIAAPDPRSIHPFLRESQFAKFAEGLSRAQLEMLKGHMEPTAATTNACVAMIEGAEEYFQAANYTALCLINSPAGCVLLPRSNWL